MNDPPHAIQYVFQLRSLIASKEEKLEIINSKLQHFEGEATRYEEKKFQIEYEFEEALDELRNNENVIKRTRLEQKVHNDYIGQLKTKCIEQFMSYIEIVDDYTSLLTVQNLWQREKISVSLS